jgi:hypothetical protein
VVLSGSAHAHLARSTRETTRFVEVAPRGERLSVTYAVAFGEMPANEERRFMDLDHDGILSPDEQAAWLDRFVLRLSESLSIEVDGRGVRPRWKPRLDMADTRVGNIAFVAMFVAEAPVTLGAHEVALVDRVDVRAAGELEFTFRDSAGARFVAARGSAGADPSERSFRFAGRARSVLEERRVSFRYEALPAPADSPPRAGEEPSRVPWSAGKILLLAAVLASALIGLGMLVRRARRASRPR